MKSRTVYLKFADAVFDREKGRGHIKTVLEYYFQAKEEGYSGNGLIQVCETIKRLVGERKVQL